MVGDDLFDVFWTPDFTEDVMAAGACFRATERKNEGKRGCSQQGEMDVHLSAFARARRRPPLH